MSWADRLAVESQINVSFGGYTDVAVNEARHGGTGAGGAGFAIVAGQLYVCGDRRPTPQRVGSRSPARPRVDDGPSSKVSQNAGAAIPHGSPAAVAVERAGACTQTASATRVVVVAETHRPPELLIIAFMAYVYSMPLPKTS